MSAFDAVAFDAPAFLPADQLSPQNIGTLRFASAGYTTRDSDTPARAFYEPRILGEIEIGQSAFGALAVGGRVALGVSEILVADADGFAADLARIGIADGRAALLRQIDVADGRASDFGAPLSGASVPFAGFVRAVERAGDFQARIALAEISDRLVTPLQPTKYQGTGGQEGGADLKGKPKPVAFGQVFNAAPVFLGNVDLGAGSLPTYQSHWRAIAGHDAIRIRGVAQVMIAAGTPTVGQARDYPALGLFQLGGAPDGDVTADLRGDTTPIYVNGIPSIIRRLLQSLGPGLQDSDFDTVSFAFAELDLPGVIGFYQGATETSALTAVEAILAGCGGILAASRGGKIRMADVLSNDTPQFTVPAEWVLSLEPVALPATLRPLPRAVAVQWAKNFAPLSNVAGIVPAADRQRLQGEGSIARAESALVTSRVAQQREIAFPGLYADEVSALARAQAWRDWIEAGPRMVTFTTDRYLGQIEVGHIGSVVYPAYGCDQGFAGVVVGWREQLLGRRLEITLIGTRTAQGPILIEPEAAPSIATSGLVLHLDAGVAASYPGSGTALTDLSGNGNNGTLTNGPTYSAADGGQIIFDGVNDFLSLIYTQPLMVENTIELWFRSTSTADSSFLFENRGAGAGRSHVLGFNGFAGTGAGGSIWTGHNSNNQAQLIRSNATNFNNGVWRQVVAVFSQPSGQAITPASFSLYENGALIATSTAILQVGSTNSPLGPGEGGARVFGSQAFGNAAAGSLAILRGYNRALPPEEVSLNFEANRRRFGL